MKYSIIIFFIILLTSCQNSTIEIRDKLNPFSQENSHQHTEEILRLNNNKRWLVVPDMMNYLQYMKEDVTKFEGTTLADYQELSTDLLINVDLLTANCTMKGEAHDQLHFWLLPYIDVVNDFSRIATVEDASKEYEKLKESFQEFDKFFK